MAPLPTWLDALTPRTEPPLDSKAIADLSVSSLELDIRSPANPLSAPSLFKRNDASSSISPIEPHNLVSRSLQKRELSSNFVPGQGTRPPDSFNNSGYLALFAIIGAAMVVVSIWFFFWAKNGGFSFEQGDWDDYKSTVLRRKGPDGRTLSNATKSTKLGGSTIQGTQHYKWAKQSAKSIVSRDEKGRKGILGKRGWGKTHSITYSDDYMTDSFGTQTVTDEMAEVRSIPEPPEHHGKRHRDRDMRDYKKERPARVGGLNRHADGTTNSDVYSEHSDQPILHNSKPRQNEKERAERKAREEAAKMERRWKKEAEEAATALARESARSIPQPKKSVSPSKPSHARQRSASRSASPKKRDFSYQNGPQTEVLNTAYGGTTSNRSASYYDAYRPRASENPRYSSDRVDQRRQSSPKKKTPARGGGPGGYRRGADSDLD